MTSINDLFPFEVFFGARILFIVTAELFSLLWQQSYRSFFLFFLFYFFLSLLTEGCNNLIVVMNILLLWQGAQICAYYAQHGVCKFGPTCKFDHPVGTLSYSPSASSLSDMPVAPYPIGFSVVTLAPSSSSSDLRHEFISGKESFSGRMLLFENTSSGSVGSIFSRGSFLPHSLIQPQASSSSSSSNTGHGGEISSSSWEFLKHILFKFFFKTSLELPRHFTLFLTHKWRCNIFMYCFFRLSPFQFFLVCIISSSSIPCSDSPCSYNLYQPNFCHSNKL